MKRLLNIAVLASGNGSSFQVLIDRNAEGLLHVNLPLLIGNNSGAFVFERARKHAIAAVHCAPSHFADETQYTNALFAALETYQIDCIVCAGYMKKIPAPVIRQFQNRIINIHPGLLPAFGGKGMYGKYVHEAVLSYGAKLSGITIHFVDEEYDHGPIIFQATVPVLNTDNAGSLAARVLTLEHAWYWRVIEAIAQGHITVEGRKVMGIIEGC